MLEGEERPPCRRGTLHAKATRHRHLLLLTSLGEMTPRRMTPRRFHIRRVYTKARARGQGRRTSRRRYSSLKLVSRPSLSRLSRLSLARCGARCPCPRERARKRRTSCITRITLRIASRFFLTLTHPINPDSRGSAPIKFQAPRKSFTNIPPPGV